jgi:hypothetical protein
MKESKDKVTSQHVGNCKKNLYDNNEVNFKDRIEIITRVNYYTRDFGLILYFLMG